MPIYWLPERHRTELKKPWGHLIPNDMLTRDRILRHIKGSNLIVSVGDATTENLLSLNISPDIQVIDIRERRIVRSPPRVGHKVELKAQNPAGGISDEALGAVSMALEVTKPVRILIEGEEDLLVLPIVALYPKITKVFYGQPGFGLVIVDVSSERDRAIRILGEMGININLWRKPSLNSESR